VRCSTERRLSVFQAGSKAMISTTLLAIAKPGRTYAKRMCRLGMVVYTCNPTTQEMGDEDCEIEPSYIARHCLNKTKIMCRPTLHVHKLAKELRV
jgi:hypothetical protein